MNFISNFNPFQAIGQAQSFSMNPGNTTGAMSAGLNLNINIGDTSRISGDIQEKSNPLSFLSGAGSFANPFGLGASANPFSAGLNSGQGMIPGFSGALNQTGSMFGGLMQQMQSQQQMMQMMLMMLMMMMQQKQNGFGGQQGAGAQSAGMPGLGGSAPAAGAGGGIPASSAPAGTIGSPATGAAPATGSGSAPVSGAAPTTGSGSAPAASTGGAAPAAGQPGNISGQKMGTAKGTGYFPENSAMEGGFNDMKGAKLRTLQDFLAGKADYVSIALDKNLYKNGQLKYGDTFRIPEIEQKYNKQITFKAVDTGGAFTNKGFSRVDICTGGRQHSTDSVVNGNLTLIKT